jgi:hypothetical protein
MGKSHKKVKSSIEEIEGAKSVGGPAAGLLMILIIKYNI